MWSKMEEAVDLRLTTSICVSNFNSQQLARVLAIARIPPAVNQVWNIKYHLTWQNQKTITSLFLD